MKFITKWADWAKFSTTLQNLANSNDLLNTPDVTRPHQLSLLNSIDYFQSGNKIHTIYLDQFEQAFTEGVREAAKTSFPIYQYIFRSKLWWTQNLMSLTNVMAEAKESNQK